MPILKKIIPLKKSKVHECFIKKLKCHQLGHTIKDEE
jgi:hypothetical protein